MYTGALWRSEEKCYTSECIYFIFKQIYLHKLKTFSDGIKQNKIFKESNKSYFKV